MKKYTSTLLLLLFMAVFTTCKKEPDAPTGTNKIEIGQTAADSVGYFAAEVSTTITSTGGNQITQHGHCWSTKSKPTTKDDKTSLGKLEGPKTYNSELTGLTANTNYYIRPYVTYTYGTVYGAEKNIKTPETGKPVVSTAAVTNITASSAQCGGINDDGGFSVSQRGVCWNTTGNPTLQNNTGHTTDGSGTGIFISELTGLTKNTTYYVAAYATNEEGTAYGQTESFLATNDLTDPRDGQTYETVIIGSQTWMAENLNYETSNSWWYNNNSANGDVYGRLYTYDAALTACPDGWHLPSDAEWTVLTDYLGGESVAGGKMKEAGTAHWDSPNTGATNTSGFTAPPGGIRYSNGSFNYLGIGGFWSSSTEHSGTYAWYRSLYFDYGQVSRFYYYKAYGYSVRCLKN